jgi:tetratricopeptide (TPR) repeat protein
MERMLAGMSGPPGGGGREASSPASRAQQLVYDAWESDDPARRRDLAHEALELWPDCADAYVLLAAQEDDLEARRALYEQGVAAGERALGPDRFREDAGHFWAVLETRPYMRAREGLAGCLWQLGRREEAVAHYQELLRLNPEDHQGVRYVLAGHLVELGQEEALARLLQAYEGDGTASWAYPRALLAFRREGASARANELLAEARKQNPHVPDLLLGRRRMPRTLPEFFRLGEQSEAIAYVAEGRAAWECSPGALDWLAAACGVDRAKAAPSTVVEGMDVRGLLTRGGELLPESAWRAVLNLGEAAVPALVEVLKDEELSLTDSPGDGWAPIHAARLLGTLKAEAAIPAMVEVLGKMKPETILYSELTYVLSQLGPAVAPVALQALEEGRAEEELGLLEVLSRSGVKSEAIFTRLVDLLHEDAALGAMFLADYGDPRALPVLIAAFDAYVPTDGEGIFVGQALIDIEDAIHELEGELTDAQLKKLDAVVGRRAHALAKRLAQLPARRKERPGRNAPCWCGSGLKYKKCHLAQDEGRE